LSVLLSTAVCIAVRETCHSPSIFNQCCQVAPFWKVHDKTNTISILPGLVAAGEGCEKEGKEPFFSCCRGWSRVPPKTCFFFVSDGSELIFPGVLLPPRGAGAGSWALNCTTERGARDLDLRRMPTLTAEIFKARYGRCASKWAPEFVRAFFRVAHTL